MWPHKNPTYDGKNDGFATSDNPDIDVSDVCQHALVWTTHKLTPRGGHSPANAEMVPWQNPHPRLISTEPFWAILYSCESCDWELLNDYKFTKNGGGGEIQKRFVKYSTLVLILKIHNTWIFCRQNDIHPLNCFKNSESRKNWQHSIGSTEL